LYRSQVPEQERPAGLVLALVLVLA